MATIVSVAHCDVQPAGGGASLVTKTGGTAGVYDASAVSAEAFTGDFVLRLRALSEGVGFVGLSPDPAIGHSYETIRWALQLGMGLLRIHENGVYRPPALAMDTFAWFRRQGDTLDCLVGPELEGAVPRRSFFDVTEPLYFDSSFETPGLTIEVSFGGPAAARPKTRRQRLWLGLAF